MITVGVEEEYLLVDPASAVPTPAVEEVRRTAGLEPFAERGEVQDELLQAQIEVATPVCWNLEQVGGHLLRLRHALSSAAEANGCRIAATGAAPLRGALPVPVTPTRRYRRMEGEARQLVDEQLICGMHVHVGVPDREMGVAVLNRIRGWLPTLLAMSVNSPLWDGRDTGFASWRTIVFRRWPLSGPPPYFDGLADYEARADALAVPGMPVMACLLVHEAHAQTGSSHAAPTEPGSCGGSRPWVNRPPGGLSGGGTCGRSRRLLHRGRC